MDLKIQKFNDLITESCNILIDCHEKLSTYLEEFELGSRKKALVDRNLVMMSVSSQRIVDLVSPLPSTGEIIGLPEEATKFGDELDVLIVDKDNPNWDFRPWFTEKSTVIRDSVNKLLDHLERDPNEMDFQPYTKSTPEEFIRSMIRSNMAEIKDKANSILYMIQSERLSITDVKLESEEDE